MEIKNESKKCPELSIVIITKNEERFIEQCLTSIFQAIENISYTQVILIDSASTDATIEKAKRFPIEIYSYKTKQMSASAGRSIGFRYVNAKYVFFVDGDCTVEQGWIELAIDILERRSDVATVFGYRCEQSSEGKHIKYIKSLGGNAMYRCSALAEVEGFNPFIVAEEEDELATRLSKKGYRQYKTHNIMCIHHNSQKVSFKKLLRRLNRGMYKNPGIMLRYSIKNKTKLHYVKRFNKPLATLGYLLLGILFIILVSTNGKIWPFYTWLFTGLAGMIYLIYRRKNFIEVIIYLTEWLIIAIFIPKSFFIKIKTIESFNPIIIKVK